ncbi:tryptophan-rich sensory protein [Dysgonomonas hofstadii]|uniref:Tryptophan-rich sensory protein n=1 Tax=Dysgonomonas hofstadii TaxID=637886 RepID=A0A840CX66_9BACT|nr:TspO/MBR family protein [Dysgonomonas hofstadii]MBB4037032.1 tryptophan-rich sensory protein [Dysgonomonas hofstadii]
MKKAANIIVPVLICFAVGYTAQYFQSDAIGSWYPALNKPRLIPPNIVFPIVWGILYLCMGISIGLILNAKSDRKTYFIRLFALQLLLNFTWSISFFYLQNPLAGMINILLLDAVVFFYIYKSFDTFTSSSILFIPYLMWICFASYLNIYILVNN